jgi:hypothetical protein
MDKPEVKKPFGESVIDGLSLKQAVALEKLLNEHFAEAVYRAKSRMAGGLYQKIVVGKVVTWQEFRQMQAAALWFLHGVDWQKRNPEPDPGAGPYAPDPPKAAPLPPSGFVDKPTDQEIAEYLRTTPPEQQAFIRFCPCTKEARITLGPEVVGQYNAVVISQEGLDKGLTHLWRNGLGEVIVRRYEADLYEYLVYNGLKPIRDWRA